jgi:hypothetical protein
MAMGFTVRVLRDRINLAAVTREWEDLALNALEPNAYYRPGALLSALEVYAPTEDIRFVLVWIDAGRRLGALFPFRGPALYKGLPIVGLKSHRQPRQRLCTPLVRAGWEHQCFHALLEWFRRDGEGASLLELRSIATGGAVCRAFAEVARERNQIVFATRASERSQTLLVNDGAWGELAISALPLLRWAKRGVAQVLYTRNR